MKKEITFLLGLIILSSICFISCEKECDDIEEASSIRINIVPEIENQPMILNQWLYLSPAGHPYKMRRLQMLLSDFKLHKTDGSVDTFDMEHYYQFGRSETYSFLLNEVKNDSYNKISFVFGLNEKKNLDNAYPDDYDMINFKWPTQLGQGYHYMRFEVSADSMGSGVIKDFNLHTGATDGNQNYLDITLPFEEFSTFSNSWQLNLVLNMNEWLRNPEIYDFEEFGHGIMGNQIAQDKLHNNGYSVFSVGELFPENEYNK